MKTVAERMGIDLFEVIRAAATKPFGFVPYYPGPGLGGHCIPIDPFYLTWKAAEYGVHARFIELAGEVNHAMPGYVVDRAAEALNRVGKPMRGSRVLVLGLAYKADVDDSRESPSAELIKLLIARGAQVDYADPHIPEFPAKRDYDFDLAGVEVTPASIASYDCLILATAHKAFDYDMIREHARLIVDTRGVYEADGERVLRG
jgi:UDP-N-acetyl-D-glucosamine dehydrogenase